MKALLVGLGSVGQRHLANLRQIAPEATITVWRRASSTSRPALADRVVHDLRAALEFEPDFAILANPAPYHLETAQALAERGVHLCIEKPIADQLRGVDELLETCRRRQLVLMVGYNLRFHGPLNVLHRAVREGRIGRVIAFQAEVGQYLPDWRPGSDYRQSVTARRDLGGGVLLELSHELDYARWLVGEVESVWAQTERVSQLEVDVEDLAEITIRFHGGALGHVHLDMVQRGAARGCRVIGTDGTLTWSADEDRVAWYCGEARRWRDLHRATVVDRNQMYRDELKHFLECIAGNTAPRVTGGDGKRALEIALAARDSSRLGRAVEL